MESKTPPQIFGKKEISLSVHLLFCILAAIVIYTSINAYAKMITSNEDEEIAGASIFLLLGGIYAGRFLSQLWVTRQKNIPIWILLLLPLIMTACIFLSVFFAGSLLKHQELMYFLFLAFPLFLLCVSTGMFIKLVRERIKQQLQEAQLVAVNSQSELQLLQAQLSPHFLFNTLNNIYGISINQHEKVPGLLLKLSDLLRYSVYEAKELYVPVKEELNYIQNFIDFEKLRLEDRLVLSVETDEALKSSSGKIAPMLLIIFVENAFKHSRNSISEKIHIEIAVKLWQDNILFIAKNSFSPDKPMSSSTEKNNGLGLENAKKRLELLYPGQYDLKTSVADGNYTVMLRLNIK